MDRTAGQVRFDISGPVGWIELHRADKRNAQGVRMTYELNEAFDRAAREREVRVVVLAGAGPHFSAGHDLADPAMYREPERGVGTWAGWELAGAEGRLAREHEVYLDMCRRWRDLPKPTIAAVHGKCIGGGLMLAWVCDLIVASEDAEFLDPVVDFGVNGVEWFAHPWELGPRRAKELLMTAEPWSAADARATGMVNHVVPRDALRPFVQALAEKIASKPTMAVRLVKESVNAMLDAQGQAEAMRTSFALHQLAHAHNVIRFGSALDPERLPAAGRRQVRDDDPQNPRPLP